MFKWKKSLGAQLSRKGIFITGCFFWMLLLFVLQWGIGQLLGIDLLSIDSFFIEMLFLVNVSATLLCLNLIIHKSGIGPGVDSTLISAEELLYLNDILKENTRIKEYRLICKNNHYYIYDESCNCLKSVDEYIPDQVNESIYSYRYYQIKETNPYGRVSTIPNCDILEESMVATIKICYSQKLEEWGQE